LQKCCETAQQKAPLPALRGQCFDAVESYDALRVAAPDEET
jgi:hypothetical protein